MRGGRGHAGRLSRRDALTTVTDHDRRLLTLLCEQRVLTQTQLERLLADTPARTLRYRTERLTRQGLVGRSRPYRDKGSAPFHYWPTRASDAFVRGEPVPRGGERAEPNPQFLHHAERLSELYVLLAVQAPTVGLRLHSFRREGEARELFRAGGRERALAPDALIHLHDENGRGLLAFVELDLGTMSHARLKTKATGYAAYAAQASWTESHPYLPLPALPHHHRDEGDRVPEDPRRAARQARPRQLLHPPLLLRMVCRRRVPACPRAGTGARGGLLG